MLFVVDLMKTMLPTGRLLQAIFIIPLALQLVCGENASEGACQVSGEGGPSSSPSGCIDTNSKEWIRTPHTYSQFDVAGVNLAKYKVKGEDGTDDEHKDELHNEDPFELYEDFDIGDQVVGDENWWDFVTKRQLLNHRPSLIFYEDKVALKRWLPKNKFEIPPLFALYYASELTESRQIEDEKKEILKFIPATASYVAKPSHRSDSLGVWLVNNTLVEDGTKLNTKALTSKSIASFEIQPDFAPQQVADSLAESLRKKAVGWASFSLMRVKPGLVIENLFAAFDTGDVETPAFEFKVFTIWGRVIGAEWRQGGYEVMCSPGCVYRNGTMTRSSQKQSLPDWVDWSRIVNISERLGANKDMLRIDIFVGVPAGTTQTKEQRLASVQYVVSELEIQPTTLLDPGMAEEATRLWIAGYKIGNYRVVPNREVPREFLETGYLSMSSR